MDPLKPFLHKEEQECGSKSNPQENVIDPFLGQERNLQEEGINPSSQSGSKSSPQENVIDTIRGQENNLQEEGFNPSSRSNLHNPLLGQETSPIQVQNHSLTPSIVTPIHSLLFLFIILHVSAGAIIYGRETNSLVDALYLSAFTMCTVGYGDIALHSIFTKSFTIVFSLLGIGIMDFTLSDVVNKLSGLLLAKIHASFVNTNINLFTCIIDFEKRRLTIFTKVGVALAFVILFSAMGTIILCFVERLSWTDSFYVSMMSSNTVKYGDISFQTTAGRLFALVWVFPSTLAVARLFVTVADAKEGAIACNLIPNREISMKDLVEVNHSCKCNGIVSESDYIIFVLSSLGKINEDNLADIKSQFQKLNTDGTGRIAIDADRQD